MQSAVPAGEMSVIRGVVVGDRRDEFGSGRRLRFPGTQPLLEAVEVGCAETG